MAFILSKERDNDVVKAFGRYRDYLSSVKASFPPAVYELASSVWYYTPFEHLPVSTITESRRSPHDGWLQSVNITEVSSSTPKHNRVVEITLRILEAHHDGHIEFTYKGVRQYQLGLQDAELAPKRPLHGDWRYDEFRLSESGFVLHEIEWTRTTWIIESADVVYAWHPSTVTSHL